MKALYSTYIITGDDTVDERESELTRSEAIKAAKAYNRSNEVTAPHESAMIAAVSGHDGDKMGTFGWL